MATFVDETRRSRGEENVLLLDNGDILQGQPTVYYYNFIDTSTPHIASRVYDFMAYDAATIGNHDIETGHAVYDRFIASTGVPVLAANVIDTATGTPYFRPYVVVERGGVRTAVLGLTTPAIPAWLPENLWSGLRFEDMEASARKWVPLILEREKPDLLVGLFHSGNDSSRRTGAFAENASLEVARAVPGFDIVITGHDHQRFNRVVMNRLGKSVAVINPANNAQAVAVVDVTFDRDSSTGRLVKKCVSANIRSLDKVPPSPRFMSAFIADFNSIDAFVSRQAGIAGAEFSSRDAYFGPSAFLDLVHRLQLDISGADISLAAPLSFDATIAAGPVRVSDMFNLYKYENLLYTMDMTGREVRDYLEESYDLWLAPHTSGRRHLLGFSDRNPDRKHNSLKSPAYNFDSAAGIRYTVDITRAKGSRVNILSMTDGRGFEPERHYRVAVNSYRATGGGDLMVNGAGIPAAELKGRILSATDLDMRYYMMKEIERLGRLEPVKVADWKFVPEDAVAPLVERDRAILFN